MRCLGRRSYCACGAARSQIATAYDHVDGQLHKAFCQTTGGLGAELGQRVGVVLIAGLEGVGRFVLAFAVANNDELLVISHDAIRFTSELMNSWVTSTSMVSVSLLSKRSCRTSACSRACTSWAVSKDSSATLSG